MTAEPTSDPMPFDQTSACFEHAPLPLAKIEGAMHIVRYVNPAFCRLSHKARDELVGRPFCDVLHGKGECLALLDRVYRTGKSESHTVQEHSSSGPVFSSYTMWPVVADERTVGVMVHVIETAPLHEKTLEMNEALLLGSLRQHELTAAADASNIHLQTEIGKRKQRERDALMMAAEVSHRIKNNLQLVSGLIGYEARRTAAPCVPGYKAMQARIAAIAELYDLISQSSSGLTIPVDAYLGDIAQTISASLLGTTSGIKIEVKAEALKMDSEYAVPFGLLVNELTTNAIKHAFPDGIGRILLSLEQVSGQIELSVIDNGVGVKAKGPAKTPETHGADYVAMFVRQLGGTIAKINSERSGTTIRIRLPLFVASSGVPNA